MDFSRDIELLVGLESVTLKVTERPDISLERCVQWHPTTIREMEPSDGQVPLLDREYTWADYRSPEQPPLGSVLVDADEVYWTILAIQKIEITRTWNAKCRNLSIIPSTLNTATLLRGEAGVGNAGELVWTMKGAISGELIPTGADTIQGRLQPAGEIAMIRFGGAWVKDTYRWITEKALPQSIVGDECRLVDSAGNSYRIVDVTGEQRIDRLPVATVIRVNEGGGYATAGRPAPLAAPVFPTA